MEKNRPEYLNYLTMELIGLALVVSIFSAFSNPYMPQAEYSLENSSTRLVLRDNRIASLYDKIRSIEHVSPQTISTPGLFTVQLVNGIQPFASIDASQMTSSLVSSSSGNLELSFSHAQVNVRIQVSLSQSAGEVLWSISATPVDANIKVGSVGYPVFDTPAIANDSIKNVLLPFYEGRLHPLSASVVPWTPKVYPGALFAQMVGCLGVKGGFLLWTSDTIANVKEFKYTSSKTKSTFSIIHRMPYQPGEWKSTYHSRISFSGPAWYDLADIYRNWASQQYWCATKFKDRTDIPEFIHNPSYHCNNQLSIITEAELLGLPKKMSDWSALLKVPVYVRGTWWEKRGGWTGIDYFPPKIGEEKTKALASDLRSRNIPFMCEITGYTWQSGKVTSNTIKNNMTQAELDDLALYFNDNNGPNLCEQNSEGELSDNIIRLCRGSSLGEHFIQDVTSELFDLGITAYHHDSDPGPTPDGISGCFNPTHGHPIPCGPWSTEITRKAFLDVCAEAARRGISNFLLTKEHCTEQLNMVVHGYISRLSETYKVAYLIPLNQYIYHEYLPIVLYNGKNDELNDIILFGQFPGGGVSATVPPVLSDYYSSMNVYSRNFLAYGRMLRPMISGIAVDKITVTEGDKDVIIAVPHVRQSAWMDDSGNIGVFAINAKTAAITVDVPVPAGVGQASLYLGSVRQSTVSVVPGQILKWALNPGRLYAIVFQAAPQAMQEQKELVSLNLYPNPTSDQLYIATKNLHNVSSLKIYSSSGSIIKTFDNKSFTKAISLSSFPAGVYMVEIEYDNKMFLRKKFTKI